MNNLQTMVFNSMKSAGVAELMEAHAAGMVERSAQRKMITSGAGGTTWADHTATINPAMAKAEKLGVPFANMGTYKMNVKGGANSAYSPGTFRADTKPVARPST